MKINVDGLKDSSGEAYPTIAGGTYPVRITKLEPRESGATETYPNGSNSLMVQVTVQPGEEGAGHTMTKFLKVPPYPAEMDVSKHPWHTNQLKRLCVACGIKIKGDELDTDSLFGAEFRAVVTLTEGKKGMQNNIDDYLPMG